MLIEREEGGGLDLGGKGGGVAIDHNALVRLAKYLGHWDFQTLQPQSTFTSEHPLFKILRFAFSVWSFFFDHLVSVGSASLCPIPKQWA